jgi:dTDP-4-amino-4,6-dideoxygalactose transaminase
MQVGSTQVISVEQSIAMTIKFVDLQAQYASLQQEIDAAILRVVRHSDFILGHDVAQFEEEFAAFCDAKHAVAVSSGTDALHLALRVLDVGPGDEVITSPHTFVATAGAIHATGARPVFADIDPRTYTLNPAQLEVAITDRTRAVIPVHLYGQPADMDPIVEICRRHGLWVLEDAAQAHGAEYKGRRVGTLGDIAAFSFYPGKNLGAYGDAGAVTTNSEELATRVRLLINHGSATKYEHVTTGFCNRMDTIQAAVLRVKLPHLPRWTEQRRKVAAWYEQGLAAIGGVETPSESEWARAVYHLYVVQVGDRDRLQSSLRGAGIATQVHYPKPVHLQLAYRHLGYKPGDFPHAETAAAHVLSLPMYPELTREQSDYIVAQVAQAMSDVEGADAA